MSLLFYNSLCKQNNWHRVCCSKLQSISKNFSLVEFTNHWNKNELIKCWPWTTLQQKKLYSSQFFFRLEKCLFKNKMTLSYFVDICPPLVEISCVVILEKNEQCATSYSTNLGLTVYTHIKASFLDNILIKNWVGRCNNVLCVSTLP